MMWSSFPRCFKLGDHRALQVAPPGPALPFREAEESAGVCRLGTYVIRLGPAHRNGQVYLGPYLTYLPTYQVL